MSDILLFADSLGAPEGPTVAPKGWILNVCSFTRDPDWPTKGGDITATHIKKPRTTHIVFSTSTEDTEGIPVALAFGPDGNIYVADSGRRSIVRVTSTGEISDFIDNYQGEPLNGTNDLVFDKDGNLFFTDPYQSTLENPFGAVYGYAWESGSLYKLQDGLAFPNGIAIWDDRLYYAETLTNKIFVCDIVGPGKVGQEKLFCKLPEVDVEGWYGPDGMKFDKEGNLYIAALGARCVRVYNQAGTLIESISVPGIRPTNLCFGGPGFNTLFVTIDDLGLLVSLQTNIPGQRLHFCPSKEKEHTWADMLPETP